MSGSHVIISPPSFSICLRGASIENGDAAFGTDVVVKIPVAYNYLPLPHNFVSEPFGTCSRPSSRGGG